VTKNLKKYYLTTPLYYVNSKPHIGHSYTEIAADVLARFHRLIGEDVLFLTGTDEHGQKIERAARDAGMTPQEFTDKVSLAFRDLWKVLNIKYDDFIRTTEPRHKKAVEMVWRKLVEKKLIYPHTYDGWYCTPDEYFFTEGFADGFVEGKAICPECKRPAEKIREDNYFFKLSEDREWLINEIRSGANIKILPETRQNEVLGFLENNELQDLCISRPKNRLAWGIPLPAEISKDHVTYVWFDALINYISAVGFGADPKKLGKWWPADVHIIGKDILRHHAIYWTILLKALDLPLPKMIFAHGWWVQGGEKMSKSRGNVVDPVEIVKTYGVDAYRYFLLRETPFGADGTFSEEALILRFNTDLANDLGNLLNRSLTMCEKYFEGEIPKGPPFGAFTYPMLHEGAEEDPRFTPNPIHSEAQGICNDINMLFAIINESISRLAFTEALREIWNLVNRSNKFIESSSPWILAKQQRSEELRLVIVTLCEALKVLAQAVWPFMPEKAEALWAQLGLKGKPCDVPFKDNMWGFFKDGGKIAKGAPLFPRIETKK